MALFKCKMCGGTLEIKNETVAECEYCGTQQTLPKLDDERRANLYDRANHFRRNNEFDKAMGIYEQILNEDNTDAESYWSLVLCRYGIEYVEDPTTHKRVPTVNRAQFTSIFDDDNYKAALSHADGYQKAIYEAEARAINEIQKGILAISQKEEPFDVFICYKETDNSGRRTPDSVLANDLYHQLTQEGFKVFFSRITLEDKLGTAYEPYIFAALNSAKVMVVLGTKPEYFKAVWVKNEWSRYLALIKGGAKKVLIPAYKDMDPYDLPDEFSHLQAQDMSKLGFMQDLIRGIKKLTQANTPKQTVVKETVIASGNTSTAPLLKRAFMFLEDGEWNSANEYCEKVLDVDPENAEAYLGKLMAELQVRKREDLRNYEKPFDTSNNYQKAIRFGNSQLADELKNCITYIEDRIEEARKDGILAKARSTSRYDPEKSIELLESINGWKDADDLTLACKKRIEEIRLAEKAQKKKTKKAVTIIFSVMLASIAILFVLTTVVLPKVRYDEAVSLIENKQYKDAVSVLKVIDGYKDSATMLEDCYIAIHGKEIYNKFKEGEVGKTTTFGTFEQDNDRGTTDEPINWIILKKTDTSMYLISEKILVYMPFHNELYSLYSSYKWNQTSMYEWLNDDFYNSAFTEDEKNLISEPSTYGIGRISILSRKEAETYFDWRGDREAYHTKFAGAHSKSYSPSGVCNDYGEWALRTITASQIQPCGYAHAYVTEDGEIVDVDSEYKYISNGYSYNSYVSIGVRPVIWISLDT